MQLPAEAQHILETVLTTTVPLAVYMFTNRRQARREIEKKHQQNQELMAQLMEERKYYPAHEHPERSGPLMAENMRHTKVEWK